MTAHSMAEEASSGEKFWARQSGDKQITLIAESVEDASSTDVGSGEPGKDRDRLRALIKDHEFDPNFDLRVLNEARALLDGDVVARSGHVSSQSVLDSIKTQQRLFHENSPYSEVRAVVEARDDPTIPVNTFRVWFLGTIFAILGSGTNEFFSNRYPGIWLTSSVAQLISYPCGIAMSRFLPTKRISIGRWNMSLNPGPFNQKEHILIAVMANVSFPTAYVTTIFMMLKLDIFFGDTVLVHSVGFRILLALSTQLLGYGCVGIARSFLVYPSIMIWPGALVQIALNKALHNDNGQATGTGWRMSRSRFLAYSFLGMFTYYWLPGYLFQAMSFFNWTTWISPDNVKLAIVTGTLCGLGLNPWPTWDWNMFTFIVDPITSPFFTTANVTIGLGIGAFFIAPWMYWYNAFNSAFFPINTNYTFDNTGGVYNVSRVLNPDFTLNIAEYEAYSAPFIGAGNAIAFTAGFATVPALLTYALLYHWKELKAGFASAWDRKQAQCHKQDIHNRLMAAYPEVPTWWFLIILLISLTFGLIICLAYPTTLPAWTIFLALFLTLTLQIPLGILTAVTSLLPGLNIISELIAGYALPNRPIANMLFKAYGTMGTYQSITFAQDLKMGHYLKIPPRTMFAAQVYATVLSALVVVAVNAWYMTHIPDICSPDQPNHFTCPGAHTFFSSAILWGVVGPRRLFGPLGHYNSLLWGFLAGLLLPIPFWLLLRWYPRRCSWARYVHVPAMLYGMGFLAPYNFSFVWPACVAGFVLNFVIKRRSLGWWQKYAYVMSSAFRVAIAVAAVVIFLAVQLHDRPVNWWGNTVSFAGVDGGAESAPMCVLRVLGEGEKLPGT